MVVSMLDNLVDTRGREVIVHGSIDMFLRFVATELALRSYQY